MLSGAHSPRGREKSPVWVCIGACRMLAWTQPTATGVSGLASGAGAWREEAVLSVRRCPLGMQRLGGWVLWAWTPHIAGSPLGFGKGKHHLQRDVPSLGTAAMLM